MAKYKKCERCELNYILAEEDYCKVCKQEMKLEKGEDDEDLEICPICGVNYMPVNQVKCDECAKKKVNEETGEHVDDDKNETLNSEDNWNDNSINNDDVEIISLTELEDEEDDEDVDDSFDDDEDGEFGKMGDNENDDDDDFDFVDPDDFDEEDLDDDEDVDDEDDYDD